MSSSTPDLPGSFQESVVTSINVTTAAGNGSLAPNVTLHDVAGNVSDAVRRRTLVVSQQMDELSHVTMWLMVYVIPVIFGFGIFGNTVSFLVFMSEKMRRVSTNIYLAALSASNGVFLVAVAVSWTDLVGLKLMHRNIICQATVYLTYCSDFLSVWLVVCITVENFVINFFLHKASCHCTVRRALSFVVLLCVTGFLLYDFAIWTTGMVPMAGDGSGMYCTTYSNYQSIVEMFTLLDVGVTLIVPTIIIIALVVPTCVKNITRNSQGGVGVGVGGRVRIRGGGGGGGGGDAAAASVVLSRRERALLRVTRLLCVIIVSFVVLTAPSHLNKLRHLFTSPLEPDRPAGGSNEMVVVFICQLFYHLSFSMNFVYFLIWGKNFRDRFGKVFAAFDELLCRCWRKFFFVGH